MMKVIRFCAPAEECSILLFCLMASNICIRENQGENLQQRSVVTKYSVSFFLAGNASQFADKARPDDAYYPTQTVYCTLAIMNFIKWSFSIYV